MSQHSLYALYFQAGDEDIVFYIGHSNDISRRKGEHAANAVNENHPEYNTYKYRWIRQLTASGIDWNIRVVVENIEADKDTEYEWILKQARYNQQRGYEFFDGYPLCNMKAGDFLEEILHKKEISTASEIGAYRKQQAAARRAVSYERDGVVRTDYPNERSRQAHALFEEYMLQLKQAAAAEGEAKEAAEQRARAYVDMINSPERAQRIKEETERLVAGEKE